MRTVENLPSYPTLVLALALVSLPQPASTQEERNDASAATVFEQTLTEEGIDAAVARFRAMMADSSAADAFQERELRRLARRLHRQQQPNEALELMQLLVEVFPESPATWYDLGLQHHFTGDRRETERCLGKTLDLSPGIPYVEWILENIDALSKIVEVQLERGALYAPGENTEIQGAYLGEEPPGRTPKVFAPGIVNSTANEYSITFAPDGKEIYFSRSALGTFVCRWEEAGWTAPAPIGFFSEPHVSEEAHVAPDGRRILFNSRLRAEDRREIYQAQRAGDGWGPPEKLFTGMYATSTLDGTIYYTVITGRPDYGVIARVRPIPAGYSESEVVGGGVNTERLDAHPFIAPDESFILFDSNRDGTNSLYVCYRRADDTWSDAICLNDHLAIPRFVGQCSLSPDGKYLFFSLHNDMYWVSADILEELRPE